jgi:hypothetical protein
MVVVADTSPINYLVLIDQIQILPRLYTRILILTAVLSELKHPVAPEIATAILAANGERARCMPLSPGVLPGRPASCRAAL